MAKIKDLVVIDINLLNDVIEKLYLHDYHKLAITLRSSKQLEPIIRDAWNEQDTTLSDYLEESDI